MPRWWWEATAPCWALGFKMAQYGVPLIGINQGRLGFITDIPLDNFEATLQPMLAVFTKKTTAA